MFRFWEQGIAPEQFRKQSLNDVMAMIAISNMVQDKKRIEQEMQKARW